MSSTFVLTVNVKASGKFSRALVVSVLGSYEGFRTSERVFSPSKPGSVLAATLSQLDASSLSEAAIMYGPEEITTRPYFAASVKQPATSLGTGPAAGIAMRKRKSPIGFERL